MDKILVICGTALIIAGGQFEELAFILGGILLIIVGLIDNVITFIHKGLQDK